MRWLLCLALLACVVAVPAALAADRDTAPDGTLAVRNGDGYVSLTVRGAVIGRFARGRLEVDIPFEQSCDDLAVWGAEEETVDFDVDARSGDWGWQCGFAGRSVRFRLVGQRTLRVRKVRNLNLSAVGRGSGQIRGVGGADGTFAVNGGDPVNLPEELTRFTLGQAATPGPAAARPSS